MCIAKWCAAVGLAFVSVHAAAVDPTQPIDAMPPPPGMAHGYVASILVTESLLIDSVIIAIGTTLLASLMPAWRASRLNIVDALRTNQ